jgi:hypothetical protein
MLEAFQNYGKDQALSRIADFWFPGQHAHFPFLITRLESLQSYSMPVHRDNTNSTLEPGYIARVVIAAGGRLLGVEFADHFYNNALRWSQNDLAWIILHEATHADPKMRTFDHVYIDEDKKVCRESNQKEYLEQTGPKKVHCVYWSQECKQGIPLMKRVCPSLLWRVADVWAGFGYNCWLKKLPAYSHHRDSRGTSF